MAKTPKIIIQKATAFQVSPEKSYLIHVPECTDEEATRLREWFKEHGVNDVVIVMTEQMQITELEGKK